VRGTGESVIEMSRPQEGRRATEAARPTFSFLTTAYRTADTLPRTIQSVLDQTRHDWELIVVDNGFDDEIAAVVEPYLSDPRIRFTRQENAGASGGTMAAARHATGRYLVPLNSDDAVTPEFCERTGELLDRDPGVAAVTTDAYQFVDPGERRLAHSYLTDAGMRGTPDGRTPLRLADVIDGPSPYYTAAIRREVWDELDGLTSDTPLVDDLDMWLRMLGRGYDVRVLPDRLGRFRVQPGSVSRPNDHERIERFEAQRERAMRRAVEHSGDPEAREALDRVVRRVRYEQHIRRARFAFREGDLDAARSHVRAAWAVRHSARSAAVLAGLRIAPGVLGAVHPVKQRLQKAWDAAWALDWYQRIRHPRSRRSDP
jgi:glycosyltransferase involved in cell wall biosynthesis